MKKVFVRRLLVGSVGPAFSVRTTVHDTIVTRRGSKIEAKKIREIFRPDPIKGEVVTHGPLVQQSKNQRNIGRALAKKRLR